LTPRRRSRRSSSTSGTKFWRTDKCCPSWWDPTWR
jgi:hypothetical protein